MKTLPIFPLIVCSLLGTSALADINIIKKDGTTQVAKGVRRDGETIMAEIVAKPGETAAKGEIGVPLAQIEKIEFPEPPILKNAGDLIVQAKAADALAQTDAALKYYEAFRDAPGSWWGELALLKMNTLVMLGREKEADALADSVSRLATDPETQRAAKVLLAAATTRGGNPQAGADALEKVLTDATRPEVLAAAAIYKGQSHLALKDWENALLCFLQVPVLHPEQKALAPASMLGVGRAHLGLDDFAKARAALRDLIKAYPGTPEAIAAKAEMEAIAKRERALAAPK